MGKFFLLVLVIVVLIFGFKFVQHHQNQPNSTAKTQYSLDDPTSPWIVVNKMRQLKPKDYAPNDLIVPSVPLRLTPDSNEMKLRAAAAEALNSLIQNARGEGINLMLASGYRSYAAQVKLYNSYVQEQGSSVADSESARPGYSEHQTGWAADLEPTSRQCEVRNCFAGTVEGKWLAAHAYQYGFIIRYPEGKQAITGYVPESWHIRYVGTELALKMHDQHIETMEDFFQLPAAPNYR